MSSITESNYLDDFLKWESDKNYSREKVTIASGNSISCGEVLGIVTASGKYAAFDQDGADGTETAAGIAIADYDASEADVEGVAIVRDAIVIEDNLTFPSDIETAEQATAMASLKTAGIIAAEEG
ncbi:head decoration protein [Desulfosarcina ovata]|uniref:Head decoration protein n=1 Tax=Desulfosarcina ovata subsp. ovata TaxID=2752305 RepID=A0A5K8AHC4_9BACT|nr:head decoration protein [Desulfosarcina ovata]BBO92057.1 hypothetical protein DSCOOX_52370 [Desulfosarcina ovata subsp. ovata]